MSSLLDEVRKDQVEQRNDYIRYVVGFVFDPRGRRVVLIIKKKPKWQEGLFNGVGGKIESGEDPYEAMQREFREETGLDIYASNWRRYGKMHGNGWECDLFSCFTDAYRFVETKEEEEIRIVDTDEVINSTIPTISNLPWLISLALDDMFGNNTGRIFADVRYQ